MPCCSSLSTSCSNHNRSLDRWYGPLSFPPNLPVICYLQILLFDFVTGEFLHSFASVGSAPGKVSGVVSVRFCPLIDHIMVVEQDNNRMSVFTEAGVFAREIRKPDGEDEHGLKWPRDVAFPPNGDTLVAGLALVSIPLTYCISVDPCACLCVCLLDKASPSKWCSIRRLWHAPRVCILGK